MVTEIWVNIGPGNVVLPDDGPKALPDQYWQVTSSGIHLSAILQETSSINH